MKNENVIVKFPYESSDPNFTARGEIVISVSFNVDTTTGSIEGISNPIGVLTAKFCPSYAEESTTQFNIKLESIGE